MALKRFTDFINVSGGTKPLRTETTAPPYTCDGSIYKPFGVAREKASGQFAVVRKAKTAIRRRTSVG